jgi:hypothetical protein
MKIILLILLSFALSINVSSQRALSDKQWSEDLDFMISRLDSIHPNLYANINKELMQERVKELKEEVPILSDNEIIVELLKIVTAIQDGHTRLHGKNLTQKWYPLRIEKFSDGYYITAITKEHSKFIGAKVLAFNNQSVDFVFEKIKDITPHDNSYGQDYFAPMYLTMSSILFGLHIIKSSDELLTVQLKIKGQNEDTLMLNSNEFQTGDDLSWFWRDYAVPTNEYENILSVDSILPLYLQKYKQPFWYDFIKENNTVYFAFNECVNDENNNFESFNNKLWSYIDSVKAKHLIIDLRNNFGGTNSYIMQLVHEIIKHDSINKKGNLFLITSKKTFSAALDCATWIEFHCNPIFVGEPTGAAPNHYADPDFSYLPNSKILLMISKYYWQDSWPWDNRKCIEPNINVDLSSVDYFNYKDPAINEIFKYIKQNQ